ncbi:13762_t:CDS:1, partial [Racocetra persica]
LIIKMFNTQRLKLSETFINNIPGKIALTSDIWSSTVNESYLSLTAHFITQEWELKKSF